MSALTLLIESLFLSKCLSFTSHILPAFNTSVLMSIKEVKNNWILKKLKSPHFKKTHITLQSFTPWELLCFLQRRLTPVTVITEAICPQHMIRTTFPPPWPGRAVCLTLVSGDPLRSREFKYWCKTLHNDCQMVTTLSTWIPSQPQMGT